MQLVNLTPHEVVIRPSDDGPECRLAPTGSVARVSTLAHPCVPIAGMPVVKLQHGSIENLPAPRPGRAYVVSLIVAAAAGRPDVLAPDTSPDSVVRDAAGRIVAVRRLARF